MEKNKINRLFIDLGANKGQSLYLYSKLFPDLNKNTDVITVEPTNDLQVLGQLKNNIKQLSKDYKSIDFINSAVGINSEPIYFYDGLGQASTTLRSKISLMGFHKLFYRKYKSLIKLFLGLIFPSINSPSIYFRKRLVNKINILDLIPKKSNNTIVDIKADIEGSEYELIDFLYLNRNKIKKINSLYIECHGLKAGFTHLNDIDILNKSRAISSNVYSWDGTNSDTSTIKKIFLSDLVKLRLRHIKRLIFNNKFKRLDYLLIDKLITRVPIINKKFHCRKVQAQQRLYISNQLSNNNKYDYRNTPERNLIKSQQSINLLDEKESKRCYNHLVHLVNNNIKGDVENIRDCSYRIALSNSNKLIISNQISAFQNEVYRFVIDPLIIFPEIIDLLLSKCFRNIFGINHQDLRLAGINLRYSSPSRSETHTTAFHRDYNSYYTVKLFIPLSETNYPFLEFLPDTELISTSQIHYTPRHIKESLLPKDLRESRRDNSSIDISNLRFIPSTCIHRERPSPESKITLIVTYLSHPDNGYHFFKAKRDVVSNKLIDKWTEDHLSFIDLI